MSRALQLAAKGFPRATPNPLVGCVLVRGGKILSHGFHRRFGGPHAEIEALRGLRSYTRGATAYVTFEPCSYWGKTPPCVDALIKAGVSKVIAATGDPNSRVRGRGFSLLRRAGIEVMTGCLQKEARSLNLPFETQMSLKRPYVILKAAMTLDGKIADKNGQSKWITSDSARAMSWKIRSIIDAIGVGVGTVVADNPEFSSHGFGRNPLRVIFDPLLRLPGRVRVIQTDHAATIIVTAARHSPRLNELFNKHVELLFVGKNEGGLNLSETMRYLALKGVQTLLIEGGARTHAYFLEQNLVDEVLWFTAPKLIGGAQAKSVISGRGLNLTQAARLTSWNVYRAGADLLIHGTLNPQGLFWTILNKHLQGNHQALSLSQSHPSPRIPQSFVYA
ncbi:MAG: bifunctional diaminohydroxyphosphoribosylaminopyrimidine deaminase/5-amino-6-(5-phosphoribosylamino)uracil reductase RibD [Elusimicrobia bacterium]|nr:bifunctional diaminohydroxyphosphoribosylaminopyrimidine deaminase/5-amino-6-(5-phosphoribosylamino)uracil reductase RibD [Elusimicrobiota bacterium]